MMADSVAGTPRCLGPWDVLLAGRNHLKTADVEKVSNRFRELRSSAGSLSDSFLTVEELSRVLDLTKGDVQPLFDLLRASEGVNDVQDVDCAFKTCDLRVLLVAMAGLTRAKVKDRMRFAALVLDEAETGFLSHDQVALVMRANTLLGMAYRGVTSASSADFEKLEKARSLILEASPSESQSDAHLQISHEDFLKLVEQSPTELCIVEPPPKKAKSSRGTPVSSRSLAVPSPPPPEKEEDLRSSAIAASSDSVTAPPDIVPQAPVVGEDGQLQNAAVVSSSEVAPEAPDAVAPGKETPSRTLPSFADMLKSAGGTAASPNAGTSTPNASTPTGKRSLSSFATLRQTAGTRSGGASPSTPSTPTRPVSFSSMLRAAEQQKATPRQADEEEQQVSPEKSSTSPVRGDRTLFTDMLRAAQGEDVPIPPDAPSPYSRSEIVGRTEDTPPLDRSEDKEDEPEQETEEVKLLEEASLEKQGDSVPVSSAVSIEAPEDTFSSPLREAGEAESQSHVNPQIEPSVGVGDSLSASTLRMSACIEVREESSAIVSPSQTQEAWNSPRQVEVEPPLRESDVASQSPNPDTTEPQTRPETTESATSAREIVSGSRSRSPRTPRETRELVERASNVIAVIAEAAKPLSPKGPSHPNLRAENLAWDARTSDDVAQPPPPPHCPPPEAKDATSIAPPSLIDLPISARRSLPEESSPGVRRSSSHPVVYSSSLPRSRTAGSDMDSGTPRTLEKASPRAGTPSSRLGTPRTPGRSAASVADFRRFPLTPGQTPFERQGTAPLPHEASESPLPAPSSEMQETSPRIPASAMGLVGNITPRNDVTPNATPREAVSAALKVASVKEIIAAARARKEEGTPRNHDQNDLQEHVGVHPPAPPTLPGQMHMGPAPPSVPSGSTQTSDALQSQPHVHPPPPPRPAIEPPPIPAEALRQSGSMVDKVENESALRLAGAENDTPATPPLTPTASPEFKESQGTSSKVDTRKVQPSSSDGVTQSALSEADGTPRSGAWTEEQVAKKKMASDNTPTPRSGRSTLLSSVSPRSLRSKGTEVTPFLADQKEPDGASMSLSARLVAMVRGQTPREPESKANDDDDDSSQACPKSDTTPAMPPIPLPPEPNLPAPPHEPPRSPRQVSLPHEPPRQQSRKKPMVPRLDFSKVLRIIDGEPANDQALAYATAFTSNDGRSSGSSSPSSGRASDDEHSRPTALQAGVGTAVAYSIDAEFHPIGSEAGNSSPSSKRSGKSFWTHQSAPAELNKQEDDETSSVLGQPEWVNWTYNRYVYEQQRESFLALARCGPLEGRRKLLLAALVLFQVALLLFFVDIGGLGTAATATTGSSMSLTEVRIILAVCATVAGCATLCFCAHNVHSPSENVDREAEESLTAGEEGLPRVSAQPRNRSYRDLLRQLKDRDAARQPRLTDADAVEAITREALTTPARLGTVARTSNAPRSWPRGERRRYQQLSEGEEEAKATTSLGSSFVRRSRGLFASSGSRGLRVGSNGLRVAPVGGVAATAVEDLPQGWA